MIKRALQVFLSSHTSLQLTGTKKKRDQ